MIALIFLGSWQSDKLSKSIAAGKEVYSEYCMQCHKVDGSGTKGLVPPLAKADFLKDRRKSLHAIKYGLKGPITVNGLNYNGLMATSSLTDEEIAAVSNYIFHTWGNNYGKIVTPKEVSKIQK